jgi:hypothetical protein
MVGMGLTKAFGKERDEGASDERTKFLFVRRTGGAKMEGVRKPAERKEGGQRAERTKKHVWRLDACAVAPRPHTRFEGLKFNRANE